jgi:hypothetical protein
MGGPLRPSLLPRLAGQSSPKIIAYHGSPHSFSRFDASKIGTGEGAQAFGHGLYFAGTEDTADFYRRKLSEDADAPERWARDFWDAQSAPDAIGSPEAAYDYLLKYIRSIRNAGPGSSYSPGLKRHYAAAEKYLLAQDPYAVPPPVRQGHMYEVEIDAPEGQLLDLDLPVQSQSPVVQDALGKYVEAPSWFSLGQEGWVGKNAYMRMAGDMAAASPRFAGGYHVVHDQPAASAALLQGGVPGIRYLDQGSRSAGEGTRNYVMFPGTEDHIRILRKYGLLAPMALPAMSEE